MSNREVRTVQIRKRGTKTVVHTQVCDAGVLNRSVTREDFEDMAWHTAIADGDVPHGAARSDYEFIIHSAP